MDKKNLFARFIGFLICLLVIIIGVIWDSIIVLTIPSLFIMVIITISAIVNWISKKAPWYEFVLYLITFVLLVFLCLVEIANHWNYGAPKDWHGDTTTINNKGTTSKDSLSN